MPGRLVMDVKDAKGPVGLKRDGSHLSQHIDGPDLKRLATDIDLAKSSKANGLGSAQVRPNRINSYGLSDLTNGVAKVEDDVEEPPPELEQFRDTLVPFGKMLDRIAQQTYFDLSELVEGLADMQVQQQPQLTNGIGGQTPPDRSATSVEKKMRLLNFAQMHKDRFIKALVLSDWARNMGDMSTLIDVSMFLRKQDWSAATAADSIYRLKESMIGAKMPAPNIEGALELLTTGEAPWMPDMGYIPLKPLSADELLDTLTDMNFALSVRLNLHEDLPHSFHKYTISNGRATFVVAGEFEVDLAIADDQPATPFYFIDIRLLFSPAAASMDDRLRNQLEAHVNSALVSSGLKGCYDVLHNFVLTHKLNILRCQALDLTRGKWIDNIEVQSIHRSVIIQYWTGLSGGKNWVELGITSGKHGRSETNLAESQSRLVCRWFRRGQEVFGHDLQFDFNDLSMERMLDHVVATHASGRLNALSEGLSALAGESVAFTKRLETSSTDTSSCELHLSLLGMDTSTVITIDPIRGSHCAGPASSLAADLERRINADSPLDVPTVIRASLCRMLLAQVGTLAAAVGLQAVPTTIKPGKESPFSEDQISFRSYVRARNVDWEAGAPTYALTAATNFSNGLTWYVSRLRRTKETTIIVDAEQLQWSASQDGIDHGQIAAHERQGAQQVCSQLLVHELQTTHVSFCRALTNEGRPKLHEKQALYQRICIKLRDILHHVDAGPPFSTTLPFAAMGILSHELLLGDQDQQPFVKYILRTRLQGNHEQQLVRYLRRGLMETQDVGISSKGDLLIAVRAPLGIPVLSLIRKRLGQMLSLCATITAARLNHFGILRSRLDELSFRYAPSYTCTLRTAGPEPTLAFGVAKSAPPGTRNPHERMRIHLQKLFLPIRHSAHEVGIEIERFQTLCQVLRGTLPIVEYQMAAEKRAPAYSVQVLCRSAITFKIAYKEPLMTIAFLVTAKRRREKLTWSIKLAEARNLTEPAKHQLGALWRDRGNGWTGLRTSAMADVHGISVLLERIDSMVRSFASGEQTNAQAKSEGTAAAAPAGLNKQKKVSEVVVLD